MSINRHPLLACLVFAVAFVTAVPDCFFQAFGEPAELASRDSAVGQRSEVPVLVAAPQSKSEAAKPGERIDISFDAEALVSDSSQPSRSHWRTASFPAQGPFGSLQRWHVRLQI